MEKYEYLMSLYFGIQTLELYAKDLKYTEVQRVIDYLEGHGNIYKMKSDPYNINRHMKSTYLIEDGVRLRIYQSCIKSNGIGFIINPATLLTGEYQPVKLWEPTRRSVDTLLKKLNKILKLIGLDSVKARDLSLSQMDITTNKWGKKDFDITPIIHFYHKCYIPRHFKALNIEDKNTRKHLFVMTNNTVTVKAYDKIYELKKNDRCPKSLKDKSILRFEVSLKREAFLKKFDLDREASLYEMLRAGYEHGAEIMKDYYDKMFPYRGVNVQYDTAKKLIESSIKNPLMREQMLYLLRKTSDSAGLSTAVRKLKDHSKDVDDRRVKKILSEFDKWGIAPITIPKKQLAPAFYNVTGGHAYGFHTIKEATI